MKLIDITIVEDRKEKIDGLNIIMSHHSEKRNWRVKIKNAFYLFTKGEKKNILSSLKQSEENSKENKMLYAIEARNFRCLKYIYQKVHPFQVLVGANASGKTTFLDTISFISDIVKDGVQSAVVNRASNFNDLTFCGQGGDIEIAMEAIFPDDVVNDVVKVLPVNDYRFIRYEIKIGVDEKTAEVGILEESAYLLTEKAIRSKEENNETELFPSFIYNNESIINKKKIRGNSRVILRKIRGNDYFYVETKKMTEQGWMPSFKFGIKKSALGNLPADNTKFPAASWLKDLLTDSIQVFILDSLHIRRPSPPGLGRTFKTDGSNLPWVIEELKKQPKQYKRWIEHLKTALPDILDIEVIDRPEDRHKYMTIHYTNESKIPSWLISDGTLRLLSLTIIAYISDFRGVYLIEEPENGIHPRAMETVYQSLSSVYSAQILLASHSPVILSMVKPQDLLCFAKTEDGITDIISGENHPRLKDWKGEVNLSDLFAGGILG